MALNDEFDDWGATEAWIHYHIACPYFNGDRNCHCLPEDYRTGKRNTYKYSEQKEANRDMCVECKTEWLESEV